MSQEKDQHVSCFVIDGVTFIGLMDTNDETATPKNVCAVGQQQGENGPQVSVGAISPFMNIKHGPVFPPAALDRLLVTFVPSPTVLATYEQYLVSLADVLEKMAEEAEAGEAQPELELVAAKE